MRVLSDALTPLASHGHVGGIRQVGLMAGIELVADRASKASFTLGTHNEFGAVVAAVGIIVAITATRCQNRVARATCLVFLPSGTRQYFVPASLCIAVGVLTIPSMADRISVHKGRRDRFAERN